MKTLTDPQKHRVNTLASPLWVLLLVLAAGCGQQAEGERCDQRNGNEDCDDGLRCLPLERLGQGRDGAVCCPQSNPSELICTPASFGLGGEDTDDDTSTSAPSDDAATSPVVDGSAAVSDAAVADAASIDASPADASSAPNESATDAATDAASIDASPADASNAPNESATDAATDAALDAADSAD